MISISTDMVRGYRLVPDALCPVAEGVCADELSTASRAFSRA
jgi:hypothetical protein